MRKRGSRCSAKAYSVNVSSSWQWVFQGGWWEIEESGERVLPIVWRESRYQDCLQRKSPETVMTLPLYRLINEDKHAVVLHWQILHTQHRMVGVLCTRINRTVSEYSSERKWMNQPEQLTAAFLQIKVTKNYSLLPIIWHLPPDFIRHTFTVVVALVKFLKW